MATSDIVLLVVLVMELSLLGLPLPLPTFLSMFISDILCVILFLVLLKDEHGSFLAAFPLLCNERSCDVCDIKCSRLLMLDFFDSEFCLCSDGLCFGCRFEDSGTTTFDGMIG